LKEIKARTDHFLPFSYKGIGGRTLGLTKALEHLHWSAIHTNLRKFFAAFPPCLTLPTATYHVSDNQDELVFCYLPSPFPPEIAFDSFPFDLHSHHQQFFVTEGPFSAGRRFESHMPHASHHGISDVSGGILNHHNNTHIPTLRFLSPLAKAIQNLIRLHCPELWETILQQLPPDFPSIGGSIFQTIALNYRTSSSFHRDVGDQLPAWIYYFDSFEEGHLSLPEFGINIPVAPKSLLGLHGKYFFHGVLPSRGYRSSISFYSHFSKQSYPTFQSVSDIIHEISKNLDWAI
jgi:hypothetical protein